MINGDFEVLPCNTTLKEFTHRYQFELIGWYIKFKNALLSTCVSGFFIQYDYNFLLSAHEYTDRTLQILDCVITVNCMQSCEVY